MRLRWLTVSTLAAAFALTTAFGVSAQDKDKTDKVDKADKKVESTATTGKLVPMDQIPAPVKATMEKEQKKDETPVAVMLETEKGKPAYAVEFTKDNKARFVYIGEDGKVLKRDSARKTMKDAGKK